MNLEEYRTLFAATGLVLILVATVPVIGLVVPFSGSGESFSEFWLLGPTRTAESYPVNVAVGEACNVFVGVGNHMGRPEYYVVYVKFRNHSQTPVDGHDSTPSPLPPLYEFQVFIEDGSAWESLLTLKVLDASIQDDSEFIGSISVNSVISFVNSLSMWDAEHNGFYYQLFLELWLYDVASQMLSFHDRSVGIWLNVTL